MHPSNVFIDEITSFCLYFVDKYSLAVFMPGLAVSVRRLHDIGKSGWYLLISLIPIVGAIIVLVWDCKEGDKGDNKYGSDPKLEEV